MHGFLSRRVRKNANSDYSTFVMSVRLSAWNNSALTGRIFMKFNICGLFEKSVEKFKFHYPLPC